MHTDPFTRRLGRSSCIRKGVNRCWVRKEEEASHNVVMDVNHLRIRLSSCGQRSRQNRKGGGFSGV